MSVDELIAAANTLNEPDLDRVLHQIATLRDAMQVKTLPLTSSSFCKIQSLPVMKFSESAHSKPTST